MVKHTKSLLSAFLFRHIVPTKKQIISSESIMSVPGTQESSSNSNNKYALYFLRNSKMQKDAVETLYRKYGFNSAVKWKIKSFSTHKVSFSSRLKRSSRYIKEMAEIFSEKGLPQELVFLPLIESEFNPYAYSSSKAAGPWQFMPSTAKKLNLRIDWWVDERRDPVKSTKAAAEYLQYLFNRFGSWNLALAAYNAGEGRISRALRKVRQKDFWTIRKTGYIARETKNYIPAYIAATAIAMHPENFGFKGISYQRPVKYDEVLVDNPMDLGVVARFTGTNMSAIKKLNPELRRFSTPPNVSQYRLRIPKGTKKIFLGNLKKTKGYEHYYVNFYLVKKGDTVAKIAMKYGSPIKTIININSLGRKALIKAGRSILMPIKRNLEKLIPQTG